MEQLSAADLILYPYQNTAESASGAVRYGLAVNKPVAVSPAPIFDDVNDVVFQLPGTNPEAIANGVIALRESIRTGDDLFLKNLHARHVGVIPIDIRMYRKDCTISCVVSGSMAEIYCLGSISENWRRWSKLNS
ncbi:hypothetical protein HGG75_21850 [Ochrobactrum pseudogrignonense]|nr:hypothetical protein [Brucella pseudogrignonensis]